MFHNITSFYRICDQIIAALLSKERDVFKHEKILPTQNFKE